MKIRKFILALTITVFASNGSNAQGIPVFDGSTFAQAMMSAKNSVEQLTQQATQIANEVQMIQNQIQTLAMLPAETFQQITGPLLNQAGQVQRLINNVQGTGFQLDRIRSEYDNLFPDPSQWVNLPAETRHDYLDRWNTELNNAAKVAMESQSVLTNIEGNNRAVQEVLSRTQGADGEVRQLQGVNQQIGLMMGQLGDMTQVLVTTGKVTATAAAAEQANAAQERAILDQATSIDKFKTPGSVANQSFTPY